MTEPRKTILNTNINRAKRDLNLLERDEQILLRTRTKIGQNQPFGLIRFPFYLFLGQILLLLISIMISYYFLIPLDTIGAVEIFLSATTLFILFSTVYQGINLLHTRRMEKLIENLKKTIEEEKQESEDFLSHNVK